MKFVHCFSSLLLTLLTTSASAMPITWQLQGVTFSDGGSASGSFRYDADSGLYSAVAITTTAGSKHPAATYSYLNPQLASDPDSLFVLDDLFLAAPTSAFNMHFSAPLTNQGGTIAFRNQSQPNPRAFENYCTESCMFFGGVYHREVLAGFITAVPVPAAFWLFGGALGALGITKRRVHRRTSASTLGNRGN